MKKLIAAVCALGMCAAAAMPQTIFAQESDEANVPAETSTNGSPVDEADIVHFEDPKLEELILNTEQFGTKIDANGDGVLTKEEMSHLYMLDASGMGITSAEGIQYAGYDASASVFDFSDNEITDVTPFAEMMANGFHFYTLNLDDNAITDFSPFFKFDMNALNGLRIAGNPADADQYFTLWDLPSELYLQARPADVEEDIYYSGTHLAILHHFGDVWIDESHGIDFEVADDTMLKIGVVGDFVAVDTLYKEGDTVLYAVHDGVRKAIPVHIGSSDAQVSDVIAEDATVKAELNTAQSLMDFLKPDSALWTINDYNWTSSDENVVRLEQNDAGEWNVVYTGYGTATITGTPNTRANDGTTISFTITVQKPGTSVEEKPQEDPQKPQQGDDVGTDAVNTTTAFGVLMAAAGCGLVLIRKLKSE